MVKLRDLMDVERLAELIKEGYVIERRHPTLPLTILNYGAKTQHTWYWEDVTEQCRGVIFADGGEVMSRPWRKFFSVEQLRRAGIVVSKDEPFVCVEKVDGSLGISYFDDDGKAHVATRGSFFSEQAVKATEMLHGYLGESSLDPKLTYLWEIVYPQNRIVVDYGDAEKLVLLAVIDTETGQELPDVARSTSLEYGFPVPRVYPYTSMNEIEDAIFDDDSLKGQEGFVLKYSSGLQIKVKTDEYQHLHRIITRVTPKRIWEHLSSGGYVKKLTNGLWSDPAAWIEQHANTLQGEFLRIKTGALADFANAQSTLGDGFSDRKTFAIWVQRYCPETLPLLFLLYDDKGDEAINAAIWRQLKPSGDQVFRPEAA